MAERYVLLGLAPARADWFRTIGQWATSAMLPAEFVRCVSLEEVRARLGSARPFSAVVVDGALPGLDRDLIAVARDVGVAVLVVDPAGRRDWAGLGAAAVLADPFSRDELLEVLAATAQPVGAATYPVPADDELDHATSGRLVAVTGPGGAGTSTLAIALAQGLAASGGRSVRTSPNSVLLADLCRAADQAMLHDARVVVPSIQELVEAHRAALPSRSAVLEQTFEVPERGYRLVLGLRQPRHWVALRPRALASTLDSLQRLADVVVADVEPDFEGEAETGSRDVEERHLLSRTAVSRASVVVAVGAASMQGLFSLARVLNDLGGFGVEPDRILPVINRSPRGPRARAELTRALHELASAGLGAAADGLVTAVHVPERSVEPALRDGVALPAALARTVSDAARAVMGRSGAPPSTRELGPERILPGSLSTFTPQEEGS